MRSLPAVFVVALLLSTRSARAEDVATSAPSPRMAPYAMPAPPEPWWARVAPATEQSNAGMAISGIALWGLGAALTGAGAGLLIAGVKPCSVAVTGFGGGGPRAHGRPFTAPEHLGVARQAQCGSSDTVVVTAIGMLVAGQLASIVAIPLFVVGNRRVPVKPEVRVGLASAELAWRF